MKKESKKAETSLARQRVQESLTKNRRDVQFAVCIDNEGYKASLELGRLYRWIPDKNAQAHGLVRIVDESGEDYLYHKSHFVFVDFPSTVKKKILALESTN